MALLLVDVINPMDFPEGKRLACHAGAAARCIARLKQRAKAAGVPVIYANDNYGRWRSDFQATVASAVESDGPGRDVSLLLGPDDDDYFVLKPKHSAFFGTTLELLLAHLGVTRLVIVGFAGDICVRFTAQDAYLRDFEVIVPRDCVASETAEANAEALAWMKRHLNARVVASASVRFAGLRRTAPRRR